MLKLVGIGKPSKYAALPLESFGTLPVVTLNRAKRASPETTNPVRMSWSSGVRMPIAKAQLAGATPNDIWSHCQHHSQIRCSYLVAVPDPPVNQVLDP